ncbi:MAG TPA: TadE/TadG family type IV pilus assembly protein [Candidatus Elarobacter sp.]|jgi:Flp pilus assembly protein TadG
MRRGERGNALVEFALVSTMALTMMFGVVDLGRALYTYHLVANAARAATRYAIVRGSTCTVDGCPATADSIQTYARGLAPAIDPSALVVTTAWSAAAGCTDPANQGPGCIVSVSVSYPFRFLVPVLPRYTMTIRSASQMVIAQ